MLERKFTLIKGGLDKVLESGSRKFISAYVTDTRLMGVVGMYVHWELDTKSEPTDFHQFFYFDIEEFGFETYKSVIGSDSAEIIFIERTLLSGLGGQNIPITEKEVYILVQEYAALNKQLSKPLPDGLSEYEFLLDAKISADADERAALFSKQCTPILSAYHAINYFLMRCFAKDFTAARALSTGDFELELFGEIPASTLCKNTIDDFKDESGLSYICQSLLESNDNYVLLLSEVTVDENLKITSYQRRSTMRVSDSEAAMMLATPEFVTVYEMTDEPENADLILADLARNSLATVHENGKLFLAFNKNNDHVQKRIFRLNEDVYGLFYMTDFGQLIIASYSVAGIHGLEKSLRKSPLAGSLIPTAKYEFKEPLLYEFIQSDFEDFDDFLDFIRDDY